MQFDKCWLCGKGLVKSDLYSESLYYNYNINCVDCEFTVFINNEIYPVSFIVKGTYYLVVHIGEDISFYFDFSKITFFEFSSDQEFLKKLEMIKVFS